MIIINPYEQVISKYYTDKNGNPQSIHFIKKYQISPIHNSIVLDGLPDIFNQIEVLEPSGMTRVWNSDEIESNTFYVHSNGKVDFDISMAGKVVKMDFYNQGIEAIGAGRVYTLLDDKGNIVETLDDIIENSRDILNEIQKVGGIIVLLSDLKTTEVKINNAEEIRVTNENKRKDNEDTRITSENKRIADENNRKSNENQRETNEDTRKSNENVRALSENSRKSNENIRINNESERKKDENIRISNEEQRKSNEDIRNIDENERKKNETLRQEKETSRVNNENIRNNNENTRKSDEVIRINSENKRIADEKLRVTNEDVRKKEEISRKNNEVLRDKSEKIRTNDENTRNKNETSRINQEKVREEHEKARVVQDQTRQNQEAIRINQEKTRVNNENTRISNEDKRKRDFNNLSDKMSSLISGHAPTGVRARDIRNITPNRLTQSLIEPFFISKNQIEGKNESGDWHDLLALNTYCDSSGGKTNALAFDKKTHKIHHYQANFGSDKWGDSKEIAYVEDINSKLQNGKYTEYTGENITCNNTLDGATRDIVVEGTTYQNVVKLDNGNKVGNGNFKLFCSRKYSQYNILTESPIKFDTTYTIIFRVLSNTATAEQVWNISNSTVNTLEKFKINAKEIGTRVFTVNFNKEKVEAQGRFIWFEFVNLANGQTKYDGYIEGNITILEGDYTNKPLPTYVEGIKSVGEVEENKISILSCGKNLFDLSQIKYYKSDRDSIIPIKNGLRLENIWATTVYFKHNLKPNTKYTTTSNYKEIKPSVGSTDNSGGKILLYSSKFQSKPLIYYLGDKGAKHTFTTPPDIEDYDMIYLYSAGGGGSYNGIVEITNIQVEESSSQTPYESYKSNYIDILLPSPLRGLNDKIKDTIESINNEWFHIQRIGKTVLNGDEGWCYEQNKYKDKMGFYHGLKISKGTAIIADKLKVSPYGDIVNDNNKNKICALDGTYNVIRVGMQKNSLNPQNEEGLKKWLKQNPVTIYYELKTPILTPLNMICDLKTYDNITHIFSKNVIPPILKFKVANSIGTAMRDEFSYLERSDKLNITKTKNEINTKIIVSNTQPDSKLNEIWIEIE